MEYANKMPFECFEKTLTRITYLMSWLSVPDRKVEDFLLDKKQNPLVLLKNDLANIKEQMVSENIEDSDTELMINQAIKLFNVDKP